MAPNSDAVAVFEVPFFSFSSVVVLFAEPSESSELSESEIPSSPPPKKSNAVNTSAMSSAASARSGYPRLLALKKLAGGRS